jgi:hypothetical protein
MDIIPLDTSLIKGSHGRVPDNQEDFPIMISNEKTHINKDIINATNVFEIIEKHILNKS